MIGRTSTQIAPEMEMELRKSHVFIPSRPSPWYGDWKSSEPPFTRQQRYQLAVNGIDAETVDRMDVRVTVTDREMWWPTTERAPFRLLTCPIVRRRMGRIMVITPSGQRKGVWPGGHLTRPKTGRTRSFA